LADVPTAVPTSRRAMFIWLSSATQALLVYRLRNRRSGVRISPGAWGRACSSKRVACMVWRGRGGRWTWWLAALLPGVARSGSVPAAAGQLVHALEAGRLEWRGMAASGTGIRRLG
jgi:hypothetical protein